MFNDFCFEDVLEKFSWFFIKMLNFFIKFLKSYIYVVFLKLFNSRKLGF